MTFIISLQDNLYRLFRACCSPQRRGIRILLALFIMLRFAEYKLLLLMYFVIYHIVDFEKQVGHGFLRWPGKRDICMVMVLIAYNVLQSKYLLMILAVDLYFTLCDCYHELEQAPFLPLMSIFVFTSLCYLIVLLCLSYGYWHTLNIPVGIDLYQRGHTFFTWAPAAIDRLFVNEKEIERLFSHGLSGIGLQEAYAILLPMLGFIGVQWFLMFNSGKALAKKAWAAYKSRD